MGCWYKTCCISNLPITYNEPVYVFVLKQEPRANSMCYSTCFYTPILLPFYSHYNDYGAGENSSGPFLQLILDSIDSHRFVKGNIEKLTEQKFWELLHDGSLVVGNNQAKKHLAVTMIRADVANAILDNWRHIHWSPPNGYVRYTLQDLYDNIPAILKQAKNQIQRGIVSIALKDLCFEKNFFCINSFWTREILDVDTYFFTLVKQDELIQAETLLREVFKTIWLNNYMEKIRKIWLPGTYEGSQENDPEAYKFFTNMLNDLINRDYEDYD